MAALLPDDLSEFDDLLFDIQCDDDFVGEDKFFSPSPATVSEDNFSENESEAEARHMPLEVPTISGESTESCNKHKGHQTEATWNHSNSRSKVPPPSQLPFKENPVPGSVFIPFMSPAFLAAAVATASLQSKEAQPLPQIIPTMLTDSTKTLTSVEKRKRACDPTLAEEIEARRRRNRESSDRSRAKRRALLQSLPEHNAALETRVLELERGLSASQAEASALRDQVSFLQSLVSGGGVEASHAIAGVADAFGKMTAVAAATVASPALPVTSPVTGVVLLAVVCLLTMNQDQGFAEIGVSFLGGNIFDKGDEAGSSVRRGGRVLLSTGSDEEEKEKDTYIEVMLVLGLAASVLWIIAVPFFRVGLSVLFSWTRKKSMLPEWKEEWTKSHSG
jgi:hypothetical protein